MSLICQVRSFNFLASTYTHLADQYYKACVRRERKYCSIGWSPSNDPDSFKVIMIMMIVILMMIKVSRPASNYKSTTGDNCAADYVVILGGSNGGSSNPATCNTPTSPATSTVDR